MCESERAVMELLVWMRPWLASMVTHGRREPQAAEPVRCAGALRMELEQLRAHLNLAPFVLDEGAIRAFFMAMGLPVPHGDAVTTVYAWVRVAVEMQARLEAYVALRDDYERALHAWPHA